MATPWSRVEPGRLAERLGVQSKVFKVSSKLHHVVLIRLAGPFVSCPRQSHRVQPDSIKTIGSRLTACYPVVRSILFNVTTLCQTTTRTQGHLGELFFCVQAIALSILGSCRRPSAS